MFKDNPFFDKSKNDYYTQKKCWEAISHLIPNNKIIWEACLLNSKSKSIQYWTEMGYNVVGDNTKDCLKWKPEDFDIIITNPPFETEIKKKILKRFIELDKPFIVILNSSNVYSNYFREIFGDNIKHLQLIIPKGKIVFEEWNQEKEQLIKCKKQPAFYLNYVCYKMDIPQEELFLRN